MIAKVAGSFTTEFWLLCFQSHRWSMVDGQMALRDNMGVIALFSANVYVMVFNATWGPVMWVMLGEMFPNQLRGSGLAFAGLSQWDVNFLITMSFPIMLTSVGWFGAYGFYVLCAIISVLFIAKRVH